jgi:hypothetical protein
LTFSFTATNIQLLSGKWFTDPERLTVFEDVIQFDLRGSSKCQLDICGTLILNNLILQIIKTTTVRMSFEGFHGTITSIISQ